MTILAPGFPVYGRGQVVALSTTSSNVALSAQTKQILFTNLDATNPAYVRMSTAQVAATNTDAIIPPGKSIVYSKDEKILAISMVAGAGTPSVHVMPLEGFGSF